MQQNSPPAPFANAAPGSGLEIQGFSASHEVKNAREGCSQERSYLASKSGNRAPVFPAWLRLLMIGGSSLLLWSAAIWAALEIARWV